MEQPGVRKFDLQERTAKFGENVVNFSKRIPVNEVTKKIIPQFVAAGTSIGANYSEANSAESGNDFKHKIGICKKEANETKYWLRIVAVAVPELKNDARKHWKEANELHLIFNSIVWKIKNKKKQ